MIFNAGKDINNIILVFGTLFFFVGAILYYLLAKTHSISISFIEDSGGIGVQTSASTEKAEIIADEFLDSLLEYSIGWYPQGYKVQEIKCPKCGSKLNFSGQEKVVRCQFCGSNIALSELWGKLDL